MSNIDKQQIRDDIAIRKSMPCFGVSPDHSLARLRAIQDTQRSFGLEVVEALLDELEAAEKRIAELTEALKQTVSGYKSCLRTGHERIHDLGGECDSPEVMIAGNPDIQQAEKLIAAAAGKGE